jgi:hypothetical protein
MEVLKQLSALEVALANAFSSAAVELEHGAKALESAFHGILTGQYAQDPFGVRKPPSV